MDDIDANRAAALAMARRLNERAMQAKANAQASAPAEVAEQLPPVAKARPYPLQGKL